MHEDNNYFLVDTVDVENNCFKFSFSQFISYFDNMV